MPFWKVSLVVTLLSMLGSLSTTALNLDCQPCVTRSNYKIKALLHGMESDRFWKQVQAAMKQAALDWNIELDVDIQSSASKMAFDIKNAAKSFDALIVNVPDPTVEEAVKTVMMGGTPVFGLGSSYEYQDATLGLTGFVGMDDEAAGVQAASQFVADQSDSDITKALFINGYSDATNTGINALRFTGFKRELERYASSVTVDQKSSLDSCDYQAVLVSDSMELGTTLTAFANLGCSTSSTKVGVFNTDNESVHEAINSGKVAFVVSQQPYLQGAMSVLQAALFVTTGHALPRMSKSEFNKYGILEAGPEFITADMSLTDTEQQCEADAFPTCPNQLALDGVSKSPCDCSQRHKMKFAGVLHAVTTDAFWDIVYTASAQAAHDFNVELEMGRMLPDDADVLHLKMAQAIEKLCVNQEVDGLFVTIPSEAVHEAIKLCLSLNIPVMSINAGPDFSAENGLEHHVGMLEVNAGYAAGQRMIAKAKEMGKPFTHALCNSHADVSVLYERCEGFERAMSEAGITYLGYHSVPEDNIALYVSKTEGKINQDNAGNWNGVGVLLTGTPQHVPGLDLAEKHPEVLLGAFDTSDDLYRGVDEGIIMFGMDQQPYLQGYLPLPLLVWQVQTKQNLVTHLIESGPAFVEASPTREQQVCELKHFISCDKSTGQPQDLTELPLPPDSAGNAVAEATPFSSSDDDDKDAAIIALSIIAAVCVLGIAFLFYRIHRLRHYVSRLDEGQRPDLTTGSYVSSAFMPIQKVVSNATPDATQSTNVDQSENI